jgi:pyruvate/2-oxoglutarate dehydrogenase complex dihydrolipoamide dehydrogenase (E3) component
VVSALPQHIRTVLRRCLKLCNTTDESIFEPQSRPDRLLIMGGGPVGIEMARAFTRLGSRVALVAPGDRILTRDDPRHAAALKEYLSQEGVDVHLEKKVTALSRGADGIMAPLDDGKTLICDRPC